MSLSLSIDVERGTKGCRVGDTKWQFVLTTSYLHIGGKEKRRKWTEQETCLKEPTYKTAQE